MGQSVWTALLKGSVGRVWDKGRAVPVTPADVRVFLFASRNDLGGGDRIKADRRAEVQWGGVPRPCGWKVWKVSGKGGTLTQGTGEAGRLVQTWVC